MSALQTFGILSAATAIIVGGRKIAQDFREKFNYRIPLNRLDVKVGLLETHVRSTIEIDNYSDFSAKMENLYARVSYKDQAGNINHIATSLPSKRRYEVLANKTNIIDLPTMKINHLKLASSNIISKVLSDSNNAFLITIGGTVNGTRFTTTQSY